MKTILSFAALLLCAFALNCRAQEFGLNDVAFVAAANPQAAATDSSLTAITSFTGGTARNDFTLTAGGVFTCNANLTVTHLGYYVTSGSTQTHRIGIWDGVTLLGSVSLDATGLSTGFHYIALGGSSFSLTATTSYTWGVEVFASGDVWYSNNTTPTSTADITLTSSGYTASAWPANPGPDAGGAICYALPNFKYTKP